MPFGLGSHSCIGQNFAMLEAKIMLALILRQFHFQLIPAQKLVPDITVTIRSVISYYKTSFNTRIGFFFRPKYGMWMRISPR